jgi:uncharacterized protein YbjT (DUF2867 family)
VRGRVEHALAASRLVWIVARPSFISGPDRGESRPAERAAAVAVDAALGGLALLGGARWRERYASMTGERLARALVTIALDERAGGKRFETAALRRAAEA